MINVVIQIQLIVKSQHEAPNFANKVSEKFGKINSPGDCLLASEYS